MNVRTLACVTSLLLAGCGGGVDAGSTGTASMGDTTGTTAGDPTGLTTGATTGLGTTGGTASGTGSSVTGDPTSDPVTSTDVTATSSDTTTGSTTTSSDTGTDTGETSSDTGMDCLADVALDDFERENLGPDWTVVYPKAPNDQVRIVESSDLGMGPGPQGFFIVTWTKQVFTADQFSEATIPTDATPGWIYQVFVRWRAGDLARYGFGYNGDMGQDTFGDWYFKYDGVPSDQTRIIANTPAVVKPEPGDTIRVEIVGYTLRGYLNGELVLEGTDTDPSKIVNGVPGLAARWADGNQATDVTVKVWESWSGGGLCDGDNPGLQDPVPVINHPGDGETRPVDVAIPFVGLATDPQDGDVPGNKLVWTSDLEGQIGTGNMFNAPLTMVGQHTITLTATDMDANIGSTSIVLNIE